MKKIVNALQAAQTVDSPISLTRQVIEMMYTLQSEGDGALDHSALIKYYQKITGQKLHQ